MPSMSAILMIAVLAEGVVTQAPAPKKTAEQRIEELEASLKVLSKMFVDIGRRLPSRSPTVDCDSTDYTEIVAEGSSLALLVACQKIESYLEGYRITLRFGNPYTFGFDGISGELAHGIDLAASFKNRVPFSTTSSFASGTWTDLVVTINPVAAKDVRYVWIRSLNVKTAMSGRR